MLNDFGEYNGEVTTATTDSVPPTVSNSGSERAKKSGRRTLQQKGKPC
jgi:hypothetical protein